MSQTQARFAADRPIGIGIIGASATGWARTAHLPALKTLPGLDVTAVSTTRLDSARATAEEFGIPEVYDNPDDLIGSDSVDLVILAVRVEYHEALLERILDAGKPVYSEWPSGSGLEQTRKLRDRFHESGVYAVTGLQARARPAIRYLRDLIHEGYVGHVLSSTLLGAGESWGNTIDPRNAYLQDDTRDGTMITIPFGHTIDAVCSVLGEFDSLTAMTAIQEPHVRLEGTNTTVEKTTPDQLLISGQLVNGTMLSAHYRGGMAAKTPLRWEINGTEGTLVVSAPSGHLQLAPITIHGASAGSQTLEELPVPTTYVHAETSLSSPAATVAETLLLVDRDLRHGTHLAPTFDDAVRRKELLQAIRVAADTGARQDLKEYQSSASHPSRF